MTTFDINALPKKRMAAGALILDAGERLLIVKPTYRAGWLIPGGVVEADESPRAGCLREVQEELGLLLPIGRLLCLDYMPTRGGTSESLQFTFFGGVLNEAQLAQIRLPADELSEWRFAALDEAATLLSPTLARRVALALAAWREKRMIYAEDGAAIA